MFSSSVLERRYSFTGIKDNVLDGPPVVNRMSSLGEYIGKKVATIVDHTLSKNTLSTIVDHTLSNYC